MKSLKDNFKFDPSKGIAPPMVILISGMALAGKSTLTKWLNQHLNTEKSQAVKILSTDYVQEMLCRHMHREEKPVLYAPVY